MMRGRAHWAVRLLRLAGIDANPLRRGSDRAEVWIRLSLLAVFLIAGPLAAIALGHWADNSAVCAARAQAATEYRVRALLLRSAPATEPLPGEVDSWPVLVPARWTGPDSRSHTGDVPAAAGARTGSAVTIWTDAFGRLVGPPVGHRQILRRVFGFVAATSVALAFVLLTLLWATRRVLDRRRLAAWERGWAVVEPHWTRRLH